jgi:hypothetical protein
MKSLATSVDLYVAEVPPERHKAMQAMVQLIRANVPKGYNESMTWGMPSWEVPLSVYPDTYNKKPLMYLALASQKNYMSLYLTAAYGSEILKKRLSDGFAAAGKKMDMGGGCLRFKKLEDLPLDTIAEHIAAVPMDDYVAIIKKMTAERKKSK